MEHFNARVHALYVKPDAVQVAAESFYAPFFSTDGLAEWIDSEALEVQRESFENCEYCLAGQVPCQPMIATGDPAEEILETAREGNYDLIVLGSHGASALRGFLLGAVHAKILHRASRPVLIVRDYREIKRVLVAYRGSQCDQDAFRFLGPLFLRRRPKLTVLRVQEEGRSADAAAAEACFLEDQKTLQGMGHEPEIKTIKGRYEEEILREVNSLPYDLVVLGAYGHTRPRILKLISDDALNLVRSTTRPVLVFRNKSEP